MDDIDLTAHTGVSDDEDENDEVDETEEEECEVEELPESECLSIHFIDNVGKLEFFFQNC